DLSTRTSRSMVPVNAVGPVTVKSRYAVTSTAPLDATVDCTIIAAGDDRNSLPSRAILPWVVWKKLQPGVYDPSSKSAQKRGCGLGAVQNAVATSGPDSGGPPVPVSSGGGASMGESAGGEAPSLGGAASETADPS